ncbi:CheR family methyltransferase [Phenylobacterium montanum]|uniref:Protein-glutamate O-methyltransferase CheR n=1 Tax=Phenylobacterium montanum TaxID=2823693 RepID=A0A975FYP0_9CAUL|nr:protein-glutamate O-methyltransferase CheR [Caulobacter sp. S6]QUD86741.1 protein-glutamate O-methyltransferase CheR [Caulobacter sp. S6]
MRLDEIDAVCRGVRAQSGVELDPTKTYVLETRLAAVARREGYDGVGDLIEAMRLDEGVMWLATEALTHSETCFFRDRTPFRHFRDEMLPSLIGRRDRPLRVWSAGCSTGQEAYSLAMMIDEAAEAAPGLKVELFASDLSERRLEKARSGLYTQFEVQRGLPIRQLVRRFEKVDELWQAGSRLREVVRWRKINLMAELKPVGHFDVIFCRNLISMLAPEFRGPVLEKLARALTADGWLVLGADETPKGLTDQLHPVAGWPGAFGKSADVRAAA